MVIEEEAFNRLLPLKPSERYKLLTDKEIYPILSASIGDTVWFDDGIKMSVGMIQYIGPVEGMGQGHWFGVELLVIVIIHKSSEFRVINIKHQLYKWIILYILNIRKESQRSILRTLLTHYTLTNGRTSSSNIMIHF